MFDDWCDTQETPRPPRKILYELGERVAGRNSVEAKLIACVRSHYEDINRIADDIAELGFPGAGEILREKLPQTPKARSGDMGEILATEYVEYKTEFWIPVRRLRYKDGREMALRGDDFIGVDDNGDSLRLLKGEAKSSISISPTVIKAAREALSKNYGRPTSISLLFIADRLLESPNEKAQKLGRKLRNEVVRKLAPITHGLFVLAGNQPREALITDLSVADGGCSHVSMCLHIADHQDFIADIYEKAGNLGNT